MQIRLKVHISYNMLHVKEKRIVEEEVIVEPHQLTVAKRELVSEVDQVQP
jgi:hypothetical protein